jgi:signal transduction histidine kinase
MPHAVCWRQDPALIWTMAIANAITFLSYTAICFTLFYLARRTRRVMVRDWAYFVVGFAMFIVACGSTHLMEVVTTWAPWFWVDAWSNLLTAALSGYVAVQLFRRAHIISMSINDYAARLTSTESEKIQMRETLLAAHKLEDWSRMSAAMSHEISNPLESVQNLLYLIEKVEGLPPEAEDYAHKARQETARVISIARATLDFFRHSAHPESIDVRTAAESVRSLLESALRERSLRLDISSTGNTTVNALPGEVRQVLLNLVRNAVEASQTHGSVVSVVLEGDADGVEVVVSDQGVGIAPEILPTLFHFGVSTKGEQGNGMGLWTVRQLVVRHGGDVGVESEPGKGTRFTLWWPRLYSNLPSDSSGSIPVAQARK